MDGHVNLNEFLSDMSGFLCCYSLAVSIMNGVAGLYVLLRGPSAMPRH